MDYFKSCKTPDEAKSQYKRLAKVLHPDMKGGSIEAFQDMEKQYRDYLATLLNNKQKDFSTKAQYMSYLENFFMENPELMQSILNSLAQSKAFKTFVKKNSPIIDAGINFYQLLKQNL